MRKRKTAGTKHGLPLSRRGEGPNPIDIYVGSRVRIRRILMGVTQETLAKSLDITFQQLQKYENGTNRISASRLFQLSRVLDVPVNFFFEGFKVGDKVVPLLTDETLKDSPLTDPETLVLVRSYYQISDLAIRKRALELIRTLGRDDEEEKEF